MNALTEFAALTLTRPGPDASADAVAAWYEAKGRLHEHLAAESAHLGPAEAAAELAHAAAAYEHARRLTRPADRAAVRASDLVTVGGWAS